ncbi:hypothetical protein RSW37_24620, partial [Escherichia coli]|uniref:hypothetical protein n=1 Tax=Escherichia coli TaxID=562 RepID=UPI0028DDFF56
QLTPVGRIKLKGNALASRSAAIYLQGFRVRTSDSSRTEDLDIVHLDSARFYGKFPDRDVVINEGEMWDAVKTALTSLYAATLMDAKAR